MQQLRFITDDTRVPREFGDLDLAKDDLDRAKVWRLRGWEGHALSMRFENRSIRRSTFDLEIEITSEGKSFMRILKARDLTRSIL